MRTSTVKCSLEWQEFQENAVDMFSSLRLDADFSDVTLVCEDNQQIAAHKVILASSSHLIKEMLQNTKHDHPLLYFWGVKPRHLSSVVDFIYNGKVQVYQSDLADFMAVAKVLAVRGLQESNAVEELVILDSNNVIFEKHVEEKQLEYLDIKNEIPYNHDHENTITNISNDKTCKELILNNDEVILDNDKLFQQPIEKLKLLQDSVRETIKKKSKTIRFYPENLKMFVSKKGMKSPLWQFFKRVENDDSIVNCVLCDREIRRGRQAASKSELGNKGMRDHVERKHKEKWTNALIELSKKHDETHLSGIQAAEISEPNTESKPTFKTTRDRHNKKNLWQFYEETTDKMAQCQVGDCTEELPQDRKGSWSEKALKEHLVVHGFIDQ